MPLALLITAAAVSAADAAKPNIMLVVADGPLQASCCSCPHFLWRARATSLMHSLSLQRIVDKRISRWSTECLDGEPRQQLMCTSRPKAHDPTRELASSLVYPCAVTAVQDGHRAPHLTRTLPAFAPLHVLGASFEKKAFEKTFSREIFTLNFSWCSILLEPIFPV